MITFRINEPQERKLVEWRRSHDCPYREADGRYKISSQLSTVGELESFRFVPTSVGVLIVSCECACGATIDLTDYTTF